MKTGKLSFDESNFSRTNILNGFLIYVQHVFIPISFKLMRFARIPMLSSFEFSSMSLKLIGSSLLFVHDGKKTSISMIDFGKTRPLPKNMSITHNQPWTRGSHEDGYLLGLDNLISLFQEITYDLQL